MIPTASIPRVLPVLLSLSALAAALPAQTYQKQVLLQNLQSPHGIHVAANGDLYYTQIPQPGVSGGTNTVSVRDGATGAISVLATGEPEPVQITMDAAGDLYWSCRSAGVILRRSGGSNSVFHTGLAMPSGIAADGAGGLYITQLPTAGTPGSMGGTNTVDVLRNGALTNISTGEPEPFDITVGRNGMVYWTCRTAGVILRFDPAAGGPRELLLNGLDNPTGIDVDDDGNIYFTEVPTPGVPGTMGGQNKVWKYAPRTAQFTLLSAGEPEPVDVTVQPDGSAVYWTCRTAGVIIKSTRTGDAPQTTAFGPATSGSTMRFILDAPGSGGALYLAASSLGRGPIAIGNRSIALELDCLFGGTFLDASSPMATGYVGILDTNGMGTAQLVLSSDPAFVGTAVFTSFLVLDANAPMGLGPIAATHRFVVR